MYPWMVLPATAQSIALGFNPKAWIGGPGANFGYYLSTFGSAGVDGVCCFAVANKSTSPEMKTMFDNIEALAGPDNLDWWGQPLYWAMTQFWKQAVEVAGIDQKALREVVATKHFNTILGDTYYDTADFGGGGGLLAKESHNGEIGQYQNGVCEVVGGGNWPATKLTADFVYPKPAFPAP
jgi:hypothetical protein